MNGKALNHGSVFIEFQKKKFQLLAETNRKIEKGLMDAILRQYQALFQLGSNKFDCPQFRPMSNVFPDLRNKCLEHVDFLDNEDYDAHFVTPYKIKDQLSLAQLKESCAFACD